MEDKLQGVGFEILFDLFFISDLIPGFIFIHVFSLAIPFIFLFTMSLCYSPPIFHLLLLFLLFPSSHKFVFFIKQCI